LSKPGVVHAFHFDTAMSIEQRMTRDAEDADASGLNPLLKDRLHAPRNVFSPGHRIRMNIVPMFLNIFVPLGMFIFVCGICSFYVMYSKPVMGQLLVGCAILFWVATVLLAINRRKYDPEPSWFIFFSAMIGLAVFFGIFLGNYIYKHYSFPFYQVSDLKVIADLDASTERGQNVMDAGMFYFAEGNHIDAMRGWHFKQKTLYCVAPIIKGKYPDVPSTQSFDFWAVGKDCCSNSASDFRCGDYNNPLARGGIRNMNDHDRAFYRLAVEQATALYGIQATNPVFFEWSLDPQKTTDSWNTHGFIRYMVYVCFALVFFVFAMAMATAKFSFMGRAESVYGEEIFDDPDWQKAGSASQRRFPRDLHTHQREV